MKYDWLESIHFKFFSPGVLHLLETSAIYYYIISNFANLLPEFVPSYLLGNQTIQWLDANSYNKLPNKKLYVKIFMFDQVIRSGGVNF